MVLCKIEPARAGCAASAFSCFELLHESALSYCNTWKRELRLSRMCCGVMLAASRPAGPDRTNSTASAVVMCSMTTLRFGTCRGVVNVITRRKFGNSNWQDLQHLRC